MDDVRPRLNWEVPSGTHPVAGGNDAGTGFSKGWAHSRLLFDTLVIDWAKTGTLRRRFGIPAARGRTTGHCNRRPRLSISGRAVVATPDTRCSIVRVMPAAWDFLAQAPAILHPVA